MLCAFGHPDAICCFILGIENRASAQSRAQRCRTSLAKRDNIMQHPQMLQVKFDFQI